MKATTQSAIIVLIIIFMVAVYGSVQLCYRLDRLDLIESLQAENANMRTKIFFLENNDWALAIQQLPPKIQREIALLNEMTYRKMIEKYEEAKDENNTH